MATHSEIERILCEHLKKTDTPTSNHQAIALVGDWGIGKTFLWQRFYENHKTSLNYKKYAYISLFGISSLEELKLKIATEIVSTESGNGLEKDMMPNLKKLGGLLSTARLSDNGVSVGIGSSVVSGLVLSSLKDTLVCLDDLERRGKNLPIDEVMGLVNYLTQEKNCYVVCLLNRDEIRDEQYDNYREKVFTYELIIDESLDLVLKKFPEDCHDVVKRFYDIFGIKNIRFYEKVLERYKTFLNKLNESKLSAISKESILSSFLLMMAFDIMPKLMGVGLDKFVNDYSEENWAKQYVRLDKDKPEYTSVERKVNDLIRQFVGYFKIDKWQLAIYDFMRNFRIDPNIATVINEDLFTEGSLANKRKLDEIMEEYYNLELQPHFSSRLTKSIKKNLHNETYGNINHWCDVLEGMGEQAKASEIESLVKQQIDAEMKDYSGSDYLSKKYHIRETLIEDRFYDYIKQKVKNNPFKPTNEQIIQFFIATHQSEERKISDRFISQMTKEQLRDVIWADLSGLKYGNRRNFIKSVITCYLLDDEQKEKFRVWAVEILQEKAATVNSEEKYVIDTYLEWTKDLTKD